MDDLIDAACAPSNSDPRLGGMRLTYEAPFLQHFTARFDPIQPTASVDEGRHG